MNKKVKRLLSISIIFVLLVVYSVKPIQVNALNNLAVSAGKNFGNNVDTTQDARNASSAYGSRGYTTVTLTYPMKSSFTESRLKADILFFRVTVVRIL